MVRFSRLFTVLVLMTLLVSKLPPMVAQPALAQIDTHPCGGTFTATADTSLSSRAPTIPQGVSPTLTVMRGSAEVWTLVAFKIQIPHTARIQRAVLEVTLDSIDAPRPYALEIHDVTTPWDEATTTWNNRPATPGSYGVIYTSAVTGTLTLDVTPLVTRWATGAISITSIALLPAMPAMYLRFFSHESPARMVAPRLVVQCAPVPVASPVDPTPKDQRQLASLTLLKQRATRVNKVEFERGALRFADVRLSVPDIGNNSGLAQAQWFLQEYRDLLRLDDPADELQLVHRDSHDQFLQFRQLHKGIPVYPAVLGVNIDRGQIWLITGRYSPDITLSEVPQLTDSEAEQLALLSAGARARLIGETQLQYLDLALLDNLPDKTVHLAWKVNLRGPFGTQSKFIDADNGAVLFDVAHDFYDWDFDLENGDHEYPEDLCGPFDDDDIAPSFDPDAAMTYGNFDYTYDWWRNFIGLKSYDHDDAQIEVDIHTTFPPAVGEPNAAYGYCDLFFFSDGWPVLDVVGHEWTHAVIINWDDIDGPYSGETGALSESLADIGGWMVESMYPAPHLENWTMGEALPNGGMGRCKGDLPGTLRDMSDPTRCGDPDHYASYVNTGYDRGGVHTNSNIHSKAWYWILHGGEIPFQNSSHSYKPVALGNAIYLFWELVKTAPSSNFMAARNIAVGTAQYQHDLGVFTSAELCTIRNAYRGVGLGEGDTDCDGKEDNVDSDSDGDGVANLQDNCPNIANSSQQDIDYDKIGDTCDPDDDNDAVADSADNCPREANNTQSDWNHDSIGDACQDSDGDKTTDALDNCLLVPNQDQQNHDDDLVGDACDPDDDNDGVLDDGDESGVAGDHPCVDSATTACDDNSPTDYNPKQEDTDKDGVGNASDLCPAVTSSDNSDPDKDGLGNPCDADDDNDAICDLNGPLDATIPGVAATGCVRGGGSYIIISPPHVEAFDNCPTTPNPSQFDGDHNNIGIACDTDEWAKMKNQLSDIFVSEFQPSQELEVPLPEPECISCGSYLPDNYQMVVNILAPPEFGFTIEDQDGIVIAKGKPAASGTQTLKFTPKTNAANMTSSHADSAAKRSASASAPAEVRYWLKVWAPSSIRRDTEYQFKLDIKGERRDTSTSIYLPIITR